MRKISIQIYKRLNVEDDNTYSFISSDVFSEAVPYVLSMISLNYSVISSQVTSNLILTMNRPVDNDIVLRSGQSIEVMDEGDIIFQGEIAQAKYGATPINSNGEGGELYCALTIAPSLFQLTLQPIVFDQTQASQISQLTGVDIVAILAGGVDQKIKTKNLLDYAISNTTYQNVFNRTISPEDLPDSVFLMTSVNASRDVTVRQSIDFFNCVMYQQEDGEIIIRELNAANEAPFDIDLQNVYQSIPDASDNTIPIATLLQYDYTDNAYTTPAAVSNYSILDPNVSVGGAVPCVLTYKPNPEFFPNIEKMERSGWFTGQIGETQINNNIVQDPTASQALSNFFKYPDAYMIASQATGVKDQFLASYQSLLTAKQLALALANYASVAGTINLEDPNLKGVPLNKVLGTVLQIQNCDMTSGLIATVNRSYSSAGCFLSFNIVPLGSYTGFWKNSTTQPVFTSN